MKEMMDENFSCGNFVYLVLQKGGGILSDGSVHYEKKLSIPCYRSNLHCYEVVEQAILMKGEARPAKKQKKQSTPCAQRKLPPQRTEDGRLGTTTSMVLYESFGVYVQPLDPAHPARNRRRKHRFRAVGNMDGPTETRRLSKSYR